jgi:iron complex outermembrane receptor protein
MTFTIKAALATASIIALASPAYAQDPASSPATQPGATTAQEGSNDAGAEAEAVNDDIIVTAQRRQERVTEVPISITVANQAQLERQQVNNLNDLNRIAPALEIQSAPAQNTGGGGAIRGIGTQSFSPGATASVGVVVDQVSQGNANIADLFDVARIEVLKGPQGTLFGLTTSAGVINITTNAPDPTAPSARFSTQLSDQGTAGSKFGQQIVQTVFNLPISANSALRVSGLLNTRQGVNRNAFTGDYIDVNRYSVRGRFLWEPNDTLSLNLIGDWFKSTQEDGGDFFTIAGTNAATATRLATCGITPGEGNIDYCIRNGLFSTTTGFGGSAQVDYDAGPLSLTSITAYRETHTDNRTGGNIYRADPIVSELLSGPSDTDIKLVTQEVRVSSPSNDTFEYTAGLFISRQETEVSPERFSITLRPAPGIRIPIVNTPGARNEVSDESMAVFGQGTLHVTDQLRAILGARYTGARLALKRTDAGTGGITLQRLNVEKFSYRVGAQYQVDPLTMAYATVSRGFKGGQIATPTAPALPYVVRPEIPQSYEAGVKTTLFAGLVADLSVFYQKVRDYQAQECNVNPATAQLVCAQTNIDNVKSRGAEINLFGRVSDRLSLNTGFIFTKATYPNGFLGTDSTQALPVDLGGKQLAFSPRYKFTLSGEYEQPITDSFGGFVSVDTIWKSRIRYQNNLVDTATFRPHWLVGGRVGVRTDDSRYSAAVFVRNLFNVNEPSLLQNAFAVPQGTPTTAAAQAPFVGAIYGPQSFRQVGLQLDAKF